MRVCCCRAAAAFFFNFKVETPLRWTRAQQVKIGWVSPYPSDQICRATSQLINSSTLQRVSVSACKAFCNGVFLAGFDEVLRVLGQEKPILDQGLNRCFKRADIVLVAAIALFE